MAYTNIDDSSVHFHTQLYTGTGSSHSVTNDANAGNFKPDWVWIKERSSSGGHKIYDSTRGVQEAIQAQSTGAETTTAQGLTAFNTDGFTVGSDGGHNQSSATYAAWQWKANGGTTAANSDGSLASVVQADTTAGFSIVTWTGAGGVRTVGHGLGVAPDMVICKNRTLSAAWLIWHKSLGVGNNLLFSTNASASGNLVTATPTSTVFQIGSSAEVSNDCVAYAFAEKQGYSKFGSYVGNGSTNGAFIYLGFKPAWVLIKRSDGATNWRLFDSKRSGFNGDTSQLYPNLSNAEDSAGDQIDLLSNGFKNRTASGDQNISGASYIYMAFAENPFVTSTGIPATAR